MNEKYSLCREMKEAINIIENFDSTSVKTFADKLKGVNRILLTGEGSSRIFPAKRVIAENNRENSPITLFTEGATQANEYDLSKCAVIGASNSGRTKELIELFNNLRTKGQQPPLLAITANENTPLCDIADESYILKCGKEEAVAATKSVIEQALFYQALLNNLKGRKLENLKEFAKSFEEVLLKPVDDKLIKLLAKASKIYFAGRNDGVAEELALKINEITRKPSAYLEGTYVLHGIEEVMKPDELLILVEPFESEYEMYLKNIQQAVGMTVISISNKNNPFPGVIIPESLQYSEYLQLVAGWNLMVKTGIEIGLNIDKPKRARKVGNEVA